MKRMLRISWFCLFLGLSAISLAQTRTEFIDAQMKVVPTAETAKYSREVTLLLPDSTYSVTMKLITGEMFMEGFYLDKALEIEHGDFKYFYGNGNPESQGRFKEGYKVGLWKRWNFDGVPKPDRLYPDEHFKKGEGRATIAARPDGGLEGLQQMVNDSLTYPKEAKDRGIEGTVYVTFIIDETGEVKQPEVKTSVHYLLDEEALRFVSSMPTWKPAAKNGIAVESTLVMPIVFDLGGSDGNGTMGKGNSSKN
ncbi:MAG: TonB family protein [Flavobacteriales bacterium]